MRRSFMLPAALVFLLLVGGTGTATIAAQTPTATGSDDLVVLDIPQPTGTEVVRFIEPERGRTWDWPLKQGTYLSGAAAGPPGVVYAGIADGRSTTVYEVDTGSLDGPISPTRIGAVSGRSMVWKRSADGAQLFVLTFDGAIGEPLGLPTRLTGIAIPTSLHGASAGTGHGASGDATAIWYGLVQPAGQDPSPTSRHLWRAVLRSGQQPVLRDTGVTGSGYYSVLLAPAHHAVYLIDYFNQRLIAVNVNDGAVKRTVTFGEHPFKRPQCGATLSPDANRLYVLSNLNSNTSSGYLVYDTHSWQRLAHVPNPSDTNPYCIGVSRDGQRLFVTSDDTLVTLDARTGAEMGRKTFDDGEDLPRLVLTTSAGA